MHTILKSSSASLLIKNHRRLALLAIVLIIAAFAIPDLNTSAQSTQGRSARDVRSSEPFVDRLVGLDFDTDDTLFRLPSMSHKVCPIGKVGTSTGIVSDSGKTGRSSSAQMVPAIIYDTTHASTQGAEITAAANGAATSMGDLIVLSGTNRFVTNVQIQVFTLASTDPFSLTMKFYTDCSTNGTANSACGNGTGTLIAGSTRTVTNITPSALGTIFNVDFPYLPNVNLSGETDNTISVSVTASRSDVFWRIGETATVGSSTDVVERCGSVGANNGCARNFGITNNFAITMTADSIATAAGTTISGRVLSSGKGRGLTGATVRLTDQNGATRSMVTGRLGSFTFDDVEPGQTYVISVASRRFNFSPRVIQIVDNMSDLEIMPE